MPRNRWPLADRLFPRFLPPAALLAVVALAAAAGPPVSLAPQFLPGRTLRYQIESRDVTTGETTTPIVNPEGGSRSAHTVHLVLRLEALPAGAGASGPARLRVTCEKSRAETESDALDLAAASADDRYARMEGHSAEFDLQPDGQFAAVPGADAAFADRAAVQLLLSWLTRISHAGVPRGSVSIGEKWKSERALPEMPLTGLAWRAESTYLRDEPCGLYAAPGASGPPSPAVEGECAILLTRFQISRRGSPKSDATPEEYRRNGLRTSGTWSGSGEGLDSISRARGLLVSSTLTSTQELDYRITSAANGSSIHHQGRIESHSEVTLLPDSTPDR